MANSDAVDLMDYGQHCAIKTCNRLDYLPFKCNKCHDTFCLEHRQEKDHNCPNAELGDSRVPVCPLCSQPVSVARSRGEDADSQVERHIISGCRDLVVVEAKRPRTARCTHGGCRRRDLVPYMCSQCERTVCLRHRQPLDHNCLPTPIPVH